MAGLAREYVKKLYYKERLEVVNKIVSTITALWVICFMDKSVTVTCLLSLATLVINLILHGMK